MAKKLIRVQLKRMEDMRENPGALQPYLINGTWYEAFIQGDCDNKDDVRSFVSQTLRDMEPVLKNRKYFLNGLAISFYE